MWTAFHHSNKARRAAVAQWSVPIYASLARLFLKLGLLAFGGPAAHIALMREEVVERRGWLTETEFLDRLAAANLIPGPSSTELALHIGLRMGGWRGLLLAGACFILPAALLVMALAWLYQRFGALPRAASMMGAVQPVVVAIVLLALRQFSKTALRTPVLLAVGAASFIAAMYGAPQLWILLLCGLAAAALRMKRVALFAPVVWPAGAAPLTLSSLFVVFLKLGTVVFGSGYVLLAFLQADLVQRLHWLTNRQLLDAVAVGQITPGPVFTTATFIGYILAGPAGAVAATVGIFLPGFVLVALSGPLLPRIRASAAASAFLDGVTAASVALIAAALLTLGRAALHTPLHIGIAAASLLLLWRFRVNAAWLVATAAFIGFSWSA